MPSISGKAAPKSIAPVTDSACTMPTAAEADCSTAVNAAPARMPSRGSGFWATITSSISRWDSAGFTSSSTQEMTQIQMAAMCRA